MKLSYISGNVNPKKLQARKIKKINLEKISYILGNENPEKISYILLYFWKPKPRKNSLYFRKRNFLIFQETETLKNFLFFRK